MKVHYLREGFAHNSSSNHGIIKCSDKQTVEYEQYYYQWENFILNDYESKKRYLLTQLMCFLYRESDTVKFIFNDLFRHQRDQNRVFKKLIKESKIGYLFKDFPSLDTEFSIDHQSEWFFPISHNQKGFENKLDNFIDTDFIKDLFEYILNKNITIIGGNDNEVNEEFKNYIYLFNFLKREYNTTLKDPKGFWVISNTKYGDIIIVDFNSENVQNYDINIKMTVPYLMDINIIDRCNNGCPFCYRSCTSQGNYVKANTFMDIIDKLHRIGVREFVIGGGDISLHPEINRIFQIAEKYKMACTLHWKSFFEICRNGLICNFMRSFKSIAISVTDITDDAIIELVNICQNLYSYDFRNDNYRKIVFQVIAEMFPIEKLKVLHKSCFYHINLLGFKEYGRGIEYSINNNLNVIDKKYIDYVMKHFYYISCDAIFVNKYKELLKEVNCEEIYLAKQDGLCSCYYDMVNNYLAQSSYSDNKIDYTPNINNLIEFNNEFTNIFKDF